MGAFSDALRQEVTKRHLRVSLVEPGAVATELADSIKHEPTRKLATGPGGVYGPGLEILEAELGKHPIANANTFLRAKELAADLRIEHPLVETECVDVVVSNCVLNLVEPQEKRQLFQEIFRVLRKGGRAVISDIVSDEDVPQAMQQDPTLWSGCISGALREDLFLKGFEDAGFYAIRLLKRDAEPWRTVEGIEFRSVTVEACKGKQGDCRELNQVEYRATTQPGQCCDGGNGGCC